MVDKLYALVEKWREDARRVRPLESTPLSSAKRQDVLRWMLWTNCANELAAALTAQGETAPTQLHAAAGAHDRMSAVELELENARIAVSDWHGPSGEEEHLKWRQAQDRLISAAKAAALTVQGETAPQHSDDCNITAALCSCGASDWQGETAPAPPSFRVLSDAEMDDMAAEARASLPPMRRITSSTPYDPHNHAIAAADAYGETAPAPVDEHQFEHDPDEFADRGGDSVEKAAASPVPAAEGLRARAEELWEQIGGDLCICQRQDVPHWCERCQQRITNIMDAITRSRQFLPPVAAEGLTRRIEMVEQVDPATKERVFRPGEVERTPEGWKPVAAEGLDVETHALLVRADSYLSLLWHRHTKRAARDDFTLAHEVEQTIAALRAVAEGRR